MAGKRGRTAKPAAATTRPREGRSAAAAMPSGALPVFPLDKAAGLVRRDEPLSRHTTFRIGGPARLHFSPAHVEAVADAVAWARASGVPWLVLGLGSNVLIRDGGFPGLVIKIGKGLDQVTERGGTWQAGAGLPMPLLARRTAEAGFAGVQRLVGVPGTVGGGVFMNAGAHGQDVAQVLVSATLLTPAGEVVERPRKQIAFTYRRSGLDEHVVLGATLRLDEDEPGRLKADLAEMLKRRRAGTPFDQPCCGSVFKNPEEMTAGRLIDRCGLKGRRVGGAEVAALHANYIVNRGTATADDVLRLIDIIRTAVFKEFGIELQLEVKVLGVSA
jgi:UDP-N-acetylmuramate dehydrogenase